jgi:hypothetical protein
MELLKKQTIDVVEVTYTIQDSFGIITYKEWLQDGNCIDSVLRDKDGYQIDDPDLLEIVILYLESIGEF